MPSLRRRHELEWTIKNGNDVLTRPVGGATGLQYSHRERPPWSLAVAKFAMI